MKAVGILLTILMTGSLAVAKYSCKNDEQKLVVDPNHKRLTLTKRLSPTKDDKPHRLKILNPANHGFKMFGNTAKAFEVEGGYVVGIKDTKNASKKDLSIFKRGEVIATFSDCTEK